MKRVVSILFAFLLLFNVMGYYGVFLGLKYRNDIQSIKKIDAGLYDLSQTFTIKTPIAIPYVSDSTDFQRIDGQYEYKGNFYRAIKQRVVRDTLYVVCMKDKPMDGLYDEFSKYVRTLADTPGDNDSSAKIFSTFIKDYVIRPFTINCLTTGWECDVPKRTSPLLLTSSFYPTIIHPPDRG